MDMGTSFVEMPSRFEALLFGMLFHMVQKVEAGIGMFNVAVCCRFYMLWRFLHLFNGWFFKELNLRE